MYHYNTKEHAIDTISEKKISREDVAQYTSEEWAKNVHGAIIITAVFDRTVRKYGSRGYRYILLEAGHVGQNICLGAAELGFSARPMWGVNEEQFEELLQLDSAHEAVVYALFI